MEIAKRELSSLEEKIEKPRQMISTHRDLTLPTDEPLTQTIIEDIGMLEANVDKPLINVKNVETKSDLEHRLGPEKFQQLLRRIESDQRDREHLTHLTKKRKSPFQIDCQCQK